MHNYVTDIIFFHSSSFFLLPVLIYAFNFFSNCFFSGWASRPPGKTQVNLGTVKSKANFEK